MSTRVAARDLVKGDIFPEGGTITDVYTDTPGVITVEVDYSVQIGPWNHGDPVHIREREERPMTPTRTWTFTVDVEDHDDGSTFTEGMMNAHQMLVSYLEEWGVKNFRVHLTDTHGDTILGGRA